MAIPATLGFPFQQWVKGAEVYLRDSKRIQVKIANPAPGGRSHTSLAMARQYEASGAAYFFGGQLVFRRGDEQEAKLRRLYNQAHHHFAPNEPSPEKPVLQPSPEWLRRMGYSRAPVSR